MQWAFPGPGQGPREVRVGGLGRCCGNQGSSGGRVVEAQDVTCENGCWTGEGGGCRAVEARWAEGGWWIENGGHHRVVVVHWEGADDDSCWNHGGDGDKEVVALWEWMAGDEWLVGCRGVWMDAGPCREPRGGDQK